MKMVKKRFKDARQQAAYEKALTMHNILVREGSGRGMAYRRGFDGLPYCRSWSSYPVYAAGRETRRRIDALPEKFDIAAWLADE